MSNNISCRESFTSTLLEVAKKNKNVIALTSDATGSTSLSNYVKELPEQFVEVGIAEQNLVGIAAGLAAVGKQPYICAPACFISSRSFEQIKVDVAYSNQNVKIFGVSGGVSYGALGYSHQSLYDIALMRAIPNMKMILPCDGNQVKSMVKKIEADSCPTYIRVGRNAVPFVYDDNAPFEIGKANLLKDGTDITIVSCGELLYYSLEAAKLLEANNISAAVIDMHTLKPIDEEILDVYAKKTKCILTVEEHSIYGGLAAAVSQCLSDNHDVVSRGLAFPDEFLTTGNSLELFKHYKLDADGIYENACQLLKIKNKS